MEKQRSALPAAALLALLALALLTDTATAQRGGGRGGSFGGSSRSFSAPSVSRPTTSSGFAPSVSRPTSSGLGPSVSAPRAPSVTPSGGFGTLARPARAPALGSGRSLALPFLLGASGGLLLGSAIGNNANGRYSRCGTSQVCYEGVCNQALTTQCRGANSTLERVTCPSTPYTECYESFDKQFTCYGVARPSSASDIRAECFAGNSTDTNTAASGDGAPNLSSGATQSLPMVAAILAAALLCAAMLAI